MCSTNNGPHLEIKSYQYTASYDRRYVDLNDQAGLLTYFETISSPLLTVGHCWNLIAIVFTVADHCWPLLNIVDHSFHHCRSTIFDHFHRCRWIAASYCSPKQEQHLLPQSCQPVCPKKYLSDNFSKSKEYIDHYIQMYEYIPAVKKYIGLLQGSHPAVRHCLSHTPMAPAPSTWKSWQMISWKLTYHFLTVDLWFLEPQ